MRKSHQRYNIGERCCTMPHVVCDATRDRKSSKYEYIFAVGIPTFPEIYKGVSHETHGQVCYRAPNRIGVQVVSL